MRADGSRAASDQPGWIQLWHTRADNPLLKYWRVAAGRQSRAPGALARADFALESALLLSLAVTLVIVLWTLEAWQAGGGLGGRAMRMNALAASYTLVVLVVISYCAIVLLVRYVGLVHLSLSFLQARGDSSSNQLYSDLLAVRPLGDRTVLFGLLLHAVQKTVWPLLLFALCGALLPLPVGGGGWLSHSVFSPEGDWLASWSVIAGKSILVFASVTLFGLLSIASHLLLFLSLGLGVRDKSMPQIGASVAGAVQGLLINIFGIRPPSSIDALFGMEAASFYNLLIVASVTSYVTAVFLLFLSAYSATLRRGLAYVFPLTAVLAGACGLVLGSLGTDLLGDARAFVDALQTVTEWFALASAAGSLLHSGDMQLLLLLLVAKLLFLWVSYWLAVRALVQHRRGEEAA